MKIGVFFSPNKELGGGYQYAVSIVQALIESGQVIYVFNISDDLPESFRKEKNVHVIDMSNKGPKFLIKIRNYISDLSTSIPFVTSLLYKLGMFNLLYLLFKLSNIKTIRLIDNKKLDLVFFPIPIYLSTMLSTPVVVSVLDLEHRFKEKFKEVAAGGRWEYREFGYRKIVQKAWRIFVDSEKSKRDMEKFYDAHQAVVLKYIPPLDLKVKLPKNVSEKIRKKFNLPRRYVFYPAKFWPHKNQINLVKAIEMLNRKGVDVGLVLTGSKEADFSTFNEIQNYIDARELERYVRYLGYVSTDELSYLYLNSLCLAMPTLMGPTYIPVYEAWKMGTPVILSDIEGCREQLGEAGLLIDPHKPSEIAEAIERLYKNSDLRKRLINKGYRRLSLWTEKDFDKRVLDTLKAYRKRIY